MGKIGVKPNHFMILRSGAGPVSRIYGSRHPPIHTHEVQNPKLYSISHFLTFYEISNKTYQSNHDKTEDKLRGKTEALLERVFGVSEPP